MIKRPAAIRFYANEDGTYPINGNGSYTVIVPKSCFYITLLYIILI